MLAGIFINVTMVRTAKIVQTILACLFHVWSWFRICLGFLFNWYTSELSMRLPILCNIALVLVKEDILFSGIIMIIMDMENLTTSYFDTVKKYK